MRSAPLTAPVLLVAHGSADPRAADATRALARVVGAATSYLDHAGPRPEEALFELAAAGHRAVTVVPLLLTAAYHSRVDIPAALHRARADGFDLPVALGDVLGPVNGLVPGALLAGLRRRLRETLVGFDGVVLAAAGTRDRAALSTVEYAARALGARLGVPCVSAYASASAPTPGEAVALLRSRGVRRVAMAAYFLAPGQLYDAAVQSALDAGAVAAAAPLTDAPELARLVRDRVATAAAAA